jgi:hypothetical protein
MDTSRRSCGAAARRWGVRAGSVRRGRFSLGSRVGLRCVIMLLLVRFPPSIFSLSCPVCVLWGETFGEVWALADGWTRGVRELYWVVWEECVSSSRTACHRSRLGFRFRGPRGRGSECVPGAELGFVVIREHLLFMGDDGSVLRLFHFQACPFCTVYTSILFYIHLPTRCVCFLCRIVGNDVLLLCLRYKRRWLAEPPLKYSKRGQKLPGIRKSLQDHLAKALYLSQS